MVEITPINNKGEKHGYWERYRENGNLWYKGCYVHGKAYGYWEWYYANGKLFYKGYYVHNELFGYWEVYRLNGELCTKRYSHMGLEIRQTSKNKFVI